MEKLFHKRVGQEATVKGVLHFLLLTTLTLFTVFNTTLILNNKVVTDFSLSYTPIEYIPTALEEAVVEIVINEKSYGSGTIISVQNSESFILTAAHVVSTRKARKNSKGILEILPKASRNILIGIVKGKINIPAEIVEINYKTDLAILKVNKKLKIKPVSIANKSPMVGETVWSITNPARLERMYLKGILSRKAKSTNSVNLGGIFGASGGMIVNTSGELFGVFSTVHITRVNGMFLSVTTYNHSPKLKDIKKIIKKAIK